MHIYFTCSGGYANLQLSYEADTAHLSPDLAEELSLLVATSGISRAIGCGFPRSDRHSRHHFLHIGDTGRRSPSHAISERHYRASTVAATSNQIARSGLYSAHLILFPFSTMRYSLLWAIALTVILGGGPVMATPIFRPPVHTSIRVVNPDQPFQLKLGEKAVVKQRGLIVQFLKVKEDSRCPQGTACLWAGQATVVVKVMQNGKSLGTLELTQGPNQSTAVSKPLVGHRVKLVNLLPYPVAHQPSSAPSYVASFLVSRVS